MSDKTPTKGKDKSHLFQKGVSGNPAGKPPGTKSRTTLLKQALESGLVENLEKDLPKAYKKAMDMALGGNEKMLIFFLERVMSKASLDLSSIEKMGNQIVINVTGKVEQEAQPKDIDGTVVQE